MLICRGKEVFVVPTAENVQQKMQVYLRETRLAPITNQSSTVSRWGNHKLGIKGITRLMHFLNAKMPNLKF